MQVKRLIGAGVAMLLAGCGAEAQTYDEAVNAYSQNRVAEAEKALRRLAADPAAAAADKAQAERELARIAWVIDGDAKRSLALLGAADATGEGACQNAILRARVLQESDRDEALLAAAPALAGRCREPAGAAEVRIRALAAALDVAAAGGAGREGALAQAATLAGGLTEDARGSLEGSALRLELALQQGDPAAALQAWKDYFWLAGTDVPQGLARSFPAAKPVFDAGVPASAGIDAQLRLVDLLVRAGFARGAERFAGSRSLAARAGGSAVWKKAVAYFQARRELVATILASNRSVARGGEAADLAGALAKMKARLLAASGMRGDGDSVLRGAYGLTGQAGNTDGYASVHYGHIVQDERRVIEQYGHRAEIAFLALDNMISNGFNSWLWDGSAEAGGWTRPDQTIVQVRSAFTANPLGAWTLFSGGPARDRLLKRQAERAAGDRALVRAQGVAYLPGLSDRLRLQIAGQVGARARALAGGGDLRRAFLQEYWRATFQQSMLSHEGRHALDRKLVRGLARLSDANLEYRAKLSELALSEYPRLALFNIDDATIGGGSGHGIANAIVLKRYARWIAVHAREVRGFDPGLPPLVQIDRLSDDQIRAVARSLDPLAPKR